MPNRAFVAAPRLWLFALVLLYVLASCWVPAVGHLSIDEGIYHLAIRAMADSGSLALDNGYALFPSREIALPMTVAHDGALFPQYPAFFPMLAAVPYAVWGYQAVFWINKLAFAFGLLLCFALTKRWFDSEWLALSACGILLFATYAFQYSQAAWPHALSMAFTLSAVYAAALSATSSRRRSLLWAFASGFIAAVSVGVRVDGALVLVGVVGSYALLAERRLGRALFAVLGAIGPLLVLGVTNHAKFGVYNPLSYGVTRPGGLGIGRYLPPALAGIALLSASVIVMRRWPKLPLAARRRSGAGLVLLVALALVLPAVHRPVRGVLELLVDLRLRPWGKLEPAQFRAPDGAIIYLGAFKKSLLQSCPFLIVAVAPVVQALRDRPRWRVKSALFLLPLLFIAFFGYTGWHGGLALNLRYFVPILPFLAILSAYAFRCLLASCRPRAGWCAVVGTLGVMIPWLVLVALREAKLSLADASALYLTLPLLLSAALAASCLPLLLFTPTTARGDDPPQTAATSEQGPISSETSHGSERPQAANGAGGDRRAALLRRLQWPALALSALALGWASAVNLSYDFVRSRAVRVARAEFAEGLLPHIEQRSLLLVARPDEYFPLAERIDLHLALPYRDAFRDSWHVVREHLNSGFAVYMEARPDDVRALLARAEAAGRAGPAAAEPAFMPPEALSLLVFEPVANGRLLRVRKKAAEKAPEKL